MAVLTVLWCSPLEDYSVRTKGPECQKLSAGEPQKTEGHRRDLRTNNTGQTQAIHQELQLQLHFLSQPLAPPLSCQHPSSWNLPLLASTLQFVGSMTPLSHGGGHPPCMCNFTRSTLVWNKQGSVCSTKSKAKELSDFVCVCVCVCVCV
jgi:hypothetical protein